MFTRSQPVLALDSNGLRVLLRLGFGAEKKNYAASYRSAQEALADQLPRDRDALIRAHQLLRQHGQELCRRSRAGVRPVPAPQRMPVFWGLPPLSQASPLHENR